MVDGLQKLLQNIGSLTARRPIDFQDIMDSINPPSDLEYFNRNKNGMPWMSIDNGFAQVNSNKPGGYNFARRSQINPETISRFEEPFLSGKITSNGQSAIPVQPKQKRELLVEKFQGASTTPPPLPPEYIQDLIWKYLPEEATPSAVVMGGENGRFDLNAINPNNNGSKDYGLGQLNDYTFNEIMSKQPFRSNMQKAGVNSLDDLLGDAERAIKAFKVFRDYERAPIGTGQSGAPPWSRWYGWQNKGYNVVPNEFTLEELANQKYDSGNFKYKKLYEFLQNNPGREIASTSR